MQQIIKNGQLVNDDWNRVDEVGLFPEGKILISMSSWNEQQVQFFKRYGEIGIWMESNENPEEIENLERIPVIGILFENFMDGRGFSIARLLRERLDYQGEVRAIGSPIRDQLSYMVKCGFDAFDLADHYDLEEALASLNDFSESYQTSVQQKTPLFRRR